ncbi:MAG: tRNA pseudouridine(38-40) synthase TruA [Candidatus Ancillula sp.]|jgi:tRNA pseudouridine38-40 synthase|nr:tRNA pseudouridine(38-40) synthase TruA [Candidatus Ancillula sp.]
MRIRLDLRYDGTDFFGWAKQPNMRTVQEELELALSKVLPGMWGKKISTVVAGRTDTGVHARHQVVHFDYSINANPTDDSTALLDGSASFSFDILLYRLRCVLPEDVVVFAAKAVEPDFSARFWAKSRTYKYRIVDDAQFDFPTRRRDVFRVKHQLDVGAMQSAIEGLTGLHDFAAFVKPRRGATSTRDLQVFKVERKEQGDDAGLVVFTLRADAFAYNMVRSLVQASVLVGQRKRDTEFLRDKLRAGVREGATGPISPRGLTLEKIEFIEGASLARAREVQIKQRRG